MTLPEQYAHDYRDMAMTEEELRKMLEGFEYDVKAELREAVEKAYDEVITKFM